MKILFVITGLGLGGAEKIVTNLADQLFEAGHHVQIAYLKGDVVLKPAHTEIELINLGFNGLANFANSQQKLKRLIQNFQPDVVHAHMFHAILFARLLRVHAKRPYLICTAHSKAIGGKIRQVLYRMTDALSDLNSNVSVEATDYFVQQKAFSAKKSVTVSNGIDTQKFQFSDIVRQQLRHGFLIHDETPVFMAVGRFTPAKDYPNLIHAFALLQAQAAYTSAKLVIVGDGELRFELEQLVATLNLQQQVLFLGARQDVAELLSMADVFVLASAWEGFGLVVAEAMSCERVVIASDCGGVKEVLAQPEYLVPVQNAQMLSRVMQNALQLSANEKATIGKRNRQSIIERYSMQSMLEQWLACYTAAIKRSD